MPHEQYIFKQPNINLIYLINQRVPISKHLSPWGVLCLQDQILLIELFTRQNKHWEKLIIKHDLWLTLQPLVQPYNDLATVYATNAPTELRNVVSKHQEVYVRVSTSPGKITLNAGEFWYTIRVSIRHFHMTWISQFIYWQGSVLFIYSHKLQLSATE